MDLDWYPQGYTAEPTLLQSLWRYQSSGYWQTNQRLRDGQMPPPDVLAIDRLMTLSPLTPSPMTVYRGVGPYEEAHVNHGRSSFVDAGFISTSFDYDVALTFAQRGGALYEITVPKGYPALWLGGLQTAGADIDGYEDEVLIKRGSRLFIHDADMVWTEDTGLIDRYTCSIDVNSLMSRRRRRTNRATDPR